MPRPSDASARAATSLYVAAQLNLSLTPTIWSSGGGSCPTGTGTEPNVESAVPFPFLHREGIRCDNECPEDHSILGAIIVPPGPTRYSMPRSPTSRSPGLAAFATAAATAVGTAGSKTDGTM